MQLISQFLPASVSDQATIAWGRVKKHDSADILTGDERMEWRSFKNVNRRREYLATRTLIWDMVQHMGLKAANFALKKNELGKPYGLYNNSEYHLSIAHTDENVLCGISADRALGVDVEPSQRAVPGKLRSRILNAEEQALLADEETIRIWTLKEALVKLQGRGLRTNLNACTILSADGDLFMATFNNDNRAKICSFEYQNNWLAIAWNF